MSNLQLEKLLHPKSIYPETPEEIVPFLGKELPNSFVFGGTAYIGSGEAPDLYDPFGGMDFKCFTLRAIRGRAAVIRAGSIVTYGSGVNMAHRIFVHAHRPGVLTFTDRQPHAASVAYNYDNRQPQQIPNLPVDSEEDFRALLDYRPSDTYKAIAQGLLMLAQGYDREESERICEAEYTTCNERKEQIYQALDVVAADFKANWHRPRPSVQPL